MSASKQKYALVTGAASGMGRSYAYQLACMGYGVVAVDRDEAALQRLMKELTACSQAAHRALVLDLSLVDAAEQLMAQLAHIESDIEVLICNAGVLTFGGFSALTEERIATVISLHITTHTKLIHRIGTMMRSHSRGYILWVSSATAWMAYPSIALYAATKNFVKMLSEALHDEWAQDGVVVTVVCPGAVDTPFYRLDKRMRGWLLRMGVMLTPDEVARRALRALFKGRKRLLPGLAAKGMALAGWFLPSWLIRRVVRIERVRRLLM